MSDEIQNAQDALTSANDAANVVRELYFVFLSIAVYMGVIVAGTTHEMLLKESPIKLPLLDVEVSILGFYVVAPYLFWIFHFHFLLQLYLLAQKLRLFEKYLSVITDSAIKEKLHTQLANVIFSHSLIGAQHDSFMRLLLRVMVSISINVMPLILLLLVQIRFIPYHSELINSSQRLVVILDALTLIIFLAKISGYSLINYLTNDIRYCYYHGLNFVFAKINYLLAYFSTRRLALSITPTLDFSSSLVTIIWSFLIIGSSFLFIVPDENCESRLDKIGSNYCQIFYAERNYACKKNIQDEISPFQNLTITGKILTKDDLTPEIVSLLSNKEKDNTLLKNLVGLNLEKRNLNCANFTNSHFMFADLQQTNLKKTNLREAQLEGANLNNAQLDEANLSIAQLDKADLSNAYLEGVNLSGAHLEEANLNNVHLEGGNLSGAYLEDAHLRDAHLEGAKLDYINLEEASLGYSYLEGTSLYNAHLEGADLFQVNLDLADIQGIILKSTKNYYSVLQRNLQSERNPELTNKILDDLKDNIEDVTDINAAKSYQYCFIGDNNDIQLSKNSCFKQNQKSEYQKKLNDFLIKLACRSISITQGIINRTILEQNINLKQALKKSNCPAIKTALINHPLN